MLGLLVVDMRGWGELGVVTNVGCLDGTHLVFKFITEESFTERERCSHCEDFLHRLGKWVDPRLAVVIGRR